MNKNFWNHVDKNGPKFKNVHCWIWTGSRCGLRNEYGQTKSDGRSQMAHRVAYESVYGPLPRDRKIVIDHLCRNPICVNPKHLELVTQSVNIRRGRCPNREKAICPQGHPYDAVNTYVTKSGGRQCRICARASIKRWEARAKADGTYRYPTWKDGVYIGRKVREAAVHVAVGTHAPVTASRDSVGHEAADAAPGTLSAPCIQNSTEHTPNEPRT